jgi:serine/threonine protein kinase
VEAVKAFSKEGIDSFESISELWKEARWLHKLAHPGIPRILNSTHTRDFLCIHMEFAGPTNLFKFCHRSGGSLAAEPAKAIIAQVASALAHCHEQGVAHGDVKPENVVLSEDGSRAQLVDFGTALQVERMNTGFWGTMPFMAPEVLSEEAYAPAPADMWSAGLMVLETLCGSWKINRMMDWPRGIEPARRLQQQLIQAFETPEEVLRRGLVSSRVTPTMDLMSSLQGLLHVVPTSRWTAADLVGSEWLSDLSAFHEP